MVTSNRFEVLVEAMREYASVVQRDRISIANDLQKIIEELRLISTTKGLSDVVFGTQIRNLVRVETTLRNRATSDQEILEMIVSYENDVT